MRHDGSMQGCCSIVEILRRRTIQETERIAYRFLSDREPGVSALTYGQLGIRAMAVGSWLMEKGLTAEPVALILPCADHVQIAPKNCSDGPAKSLSVQYRVCDD
jgi:acyl-CoA synthetase (AMP-forming)/AMP-acid ligase II